MSNATPTTANGQTQALIDSFENSKKVMPSLTQERKFIKHVTLSNGVKAEIRLEIMSDSHLFMNKLP
jgi:hypothetical protein